MLYLYNIFHFFVFFLICWTLLILGFKLYWTVILGIAIDIFIFPVIFEILIKVIYAIDNFMRKK